MIDKEAIKSRILDLEKQYSVALATLEAINGAMQECRYWLQSFEPASSAEVIELKK